MKKDRGYYDQDGVLDYSTSKTSKQNHKEKMFSKYHKYQDESDEFEIFKGPWRCLVYYELIEEEGYEVLYFRASLKEFNFDFEDDENKIIVFTKTNEEVKKFERFLRNEMEFSEESIDSILNE